MPFRPNMAKSPGEFRRPTQPNHLRAKSRCRTTSPLCGLGMRGIPGVWHLNRSIRGFRKRRCVILIYISFWPWWTLFEMDARASERLLSGTWCVGYGRLMANPNFQLLVDAAKLLKPILGELTNETG